MLSNGQTLSSRYDVIRQLKEGGMGAIYEALDTRLNARVAIKENFFSEEYLQIAFRREAQLLANLSHPSLPRVIDYFFEGEGQYLVMEFVDGEDLAALAVQRKQPFPTGSVLGWARQLLSALQYLHGQPTPILHRDIKPSNLKVKDGQVFLLDFGLAYGHSGEMSTIVRSQFNWDGRSPRYSPLEQLNCQPTMPASDLYSLAATLYELLAGSPPARCEDRSRTIELGKTDPLKDIRSYRPDLDRDVVRTIMQCLALDVSRRPQDATEMFRMMFPVPVKKPRSLSVGALIILLLVLGMLPFGVIAGFKASSLRTTRCQNPSDSSIRRLLRCPTTTEVSGLAQTSAVSSDPAALQLSAEAEELLQSGKYDAAINKAQEVLALAPNYVYALFIYGDALWDTRYGTAESLAEMPGVQEQADKILRLVLSPQTWEEYLARAWANLAKGKSEIAIADASKALQLKPDCVSALMIRATARSGGAASAAKTKQSLESLPDYDEVVRLRPNYAQARANRAAVYLDLGQHRLAVSDFSEAIRLMPKAIFHIGLGGAYLSLKEYDNARREYREALTADARLYDASVGLADVYFEEEDWGNAVRNYTSAIKIRGTSYAHSKRAFAYYQLKQFEKAVQDLTASINLDPTDYRSYYLRAYAYSQLTLWDKAIADYTEALERAPKEDLGALYQHRGQAYKQLAENRLARLDEKRAHDLGQ